MGFSDLSLENRVLKGLGVALVLCNDIFEKYDGNSRPGNDWYEARDYVNGMRKAVDNARIGFEDTQCNSLVEELRVQSAKILRDRSFRIIEEARSHRVETLVHIDYALGVFSAYIALTDYVFGDRKLALVKISMGALLCLGAYCLSKINYYAAKRTKSKLLDMIDHSIKVMENDSAAFKNAIYQGYHQLAELIPVVK